jgi:hypothetical protein
LDRTLLERTLTHFGETTVRETLCLIAGLRPDPAIRSFLQSEIVPSAIARGTDPRVGAALVEATERHRA